MVIFWSVLAALIVFSLLPILVPLIARALLIAVAIIGMIILYAISGALPGIMLFVVTVAVFHISIGAVIFAAGRLLGLGWYISKPN